MCGIAGNFAFSTPNILENIWYKVAETLNKRGPDHQSITQINHTTLVHARLSIIDTSSVAHQPIYDSTGRFAIIFNGEIFNFQKIKEDLVSKGYNSFKTQSDTEVLLYAYIHYKEKCLDLLNGFFAFAVYDKLEDELFIANDRYAEKPLYYSQQDDGFYFASELKALMQLPIEKSLDWTAVSLYFQLNYIPNDISIFNKIKKLHAGHYIKVRSHKVELIQWYHLPYSAEDAERNLLSYKQQQDKLRTLLDDAVRLRLIADVPIGAFLSGGIDSSVIVSLASKHTPHLNTFSIGFEDNAYFDETEYANLVANHFKTNHTVFKLKNDDLLQSLQELLDYTDEPFADSSALLVNLLSKYTKQHVTVALSGDGGDELFAGYNKHYGEWQSRNGGWKASVIQSLLPVWQKLPKSRSGGFGNKFRQLERFATGMNLSPAERYWRWCCFMDDDELNFLLNGKPEAVLENIIKVRQQFTQFVHSDGTLNDCLRADVALVLANDMFVKVDRMSMRNSLEVRAPFLDYRVVEYAFTLPVSSKIDAHLKKKIIQDTFRDVLPKELYNRPKKGFEVPLLQWFRTDLKDYLDKEIFDEDFIKTQNIFNLEYIRSLKQQLFSNNPNDVHAKIWALIVFQNFYKKYIL
ncbi:MAG TPA: asparagine synthase (glutamine-hydrolyzing) [Chitinophagales bacterium]|nr:asparagine synthase (glutamine-hydrolyzing) [Chitinophagales bacterium]HMU97826.1 asparagine synthase (glutamine-hydrolyzing) [Chitinophagales bacterium]HMV03351.1 asparagine synthase (glutamine-hydrolyzing) [Chitinophagales bacterium]HMW94041.1 asparagine synthase (glutamine-hydrolyzing) [Chitinophagales bacterium]HMZ67998.1 asparagine synthase (glutamine-hydrolyzing) [Chitinophagales bacterium]